MNIQELQRRVYENSVEHGFYDYRQDVSIVKTFLAELSSVDGRDLTLYATLHRILADYETLQLERKLLLAIGELCEAHEELRDGHHPTETYTKGEFGNVTGMPNHFFVKPEGFPSEIADAVIRILDMSDSVGVDVETAVGTKMAYNASRPHKHGKRF